jgi:hypothetical protein
VPRSPGHWSCNPKMATRGPVGRTDLLIPFRNHLRLPELHERLLPTPSLRIHVLHSPQRWSPRELAPAGVALVGDGPL